MRLSQWELLTYEIIRDFPFVYFELILEIHLYVYYFYLFNNDNILFFITIHNRPIIINFDQEYMQFISLICKN